MKKTAIAFALILATPVVFATGAKLLVTGPASVYVHDGLSQELVVDGEAAKLIYQSLQGKKVNGNKVAETQIVCGDYGRGMFSCSIAVPLSTGDN